MTGNAIVVHQPKALLRLERRVRRRLWQAVAGWAASLPLAHEAVAAYFCAIDPRTPISVKAGLITALAGFLLPGRLIPKVLRSLVVSGDVGLLLGALQAFAAHIRPEHRQRARLLVIRLRRAPSP
jgi:uncharacterized membrane protein YkvA (DUF1232 family)